MVWDGARLRFRRERLHRLPVRRSRRRAIEFHRLRLRPLIPYFDSVWARILQETRQLLAEKLLLGEVSAFKTVFACAGSPVQLMLTWSITSDQISQGQILQSGSEYPSRSDVACR